MRQLLTVCLLPLAACRLPLLYLFVGLVTIAYPACLDAAIHAFVSAQSPANVPDSGPLSAFASSYSEIFGIPTGLATARSQLSLGVLQLGASAWANGSNGVQGIATWVDEVTIHSASGAALPDRLHFQFMLDGFLSTNPTIAGNLTQAVAFVELSAGEGSFFVGSVVAQRELRTDGATNQQIDSNANATFDGPGFASLTSHFGLIDFAMPVLETFPVYFGLWAFAGTGFSGVAESSFGQTATFVSVLLPDGTTPESQGFSLEFQSGMLSPNLTSNAVPEPTSLTLFVTGALVLPFLSARCLRRGRRPGGWVCAA